ncbi:MAG TPA: sigma-70 family RNA polymerase sigma factor [Blastocatellia bacterium]|mgnify:CR=1 FL=1|nr:sigma-70 family RNA polymerase sigma factor [Blastocatellia bacterium]HMV87951.1 sigma-70 family RNA polymerase sigma factor [Blastocatellia bacterium]HMX27497.1 sigma-70 family RNA polymerase sigma factor [Blastocatellia bacterium]HMY74095.1 sigma-70 family RNA polymerase sigma factor [Blastocatellia bacterium]HMZ21911.1 sigma-70 family RNA polymerase sigma factor [Blastocatellia bacterium]
MATSISSEVTQLLLAWGDGDEAARDRLLPLVYDELRRLARHHMRREQPGHTLQTSALIHEAFLRMIEQTVPWQNRAHFFGIAARLMRQILVNHAVARRSLKRGGDQQQVSLTAAADLSSGRAVEILALDEALKSLAELDQRKSHIIELRFFGGLTNEEIAEVMGISLSTVEREWRLAKAWLQREMEKR